VKKKNKTNVGKVRFEPKAIGREGVADNHYTIRSTQFEWQTDPFVKTGVSVVTSLHYDADTSHNNGSTQTLLERAIMYFLQKLSWVIARATIDLELKIRTTEENLISSPKKNTIVSVCMTDVRSYVYLQEPLASAMSYSQLIIIVMENDFFTCLFLESAKY